MIEENKHTGFNKDGHLDENSIAACAEWLNDQERELDQDLKLHLEKCIQCKSEVLEVSEIILGQSMGDSGARERFEETCAAKHSPSVKSGKGIKIWQAAAVILVLLSITVLAMLLKPEKTNTEYAEQESRDSLIHQTEGITKDSIELDSNTVNPETKDIHEVEPDRYAANFVQNDGLEALIGAKYRGRTGPLITSPPADTTLIKGVIKFIGQNPGKEKLELQVLNNRAEIVMKYPDIIELNLSIELPGEPGLYYWKISGEEELYMVGKIKVEEAAK